jgi:hypothetical protein
MRWLWPDQASRGLLLASQGQRPARLRRERTLFLLEFFEAHPCVDCGETDPVVLEFDHLASTTKSFNIGQVLIDRNWQAILDEIEKCQVVCANCHRRRTATTRGFARALLMAA